LILESMILKSVSENKMVYAIQFIMLRLIENILIKIINNFKSVAILYFKDRK